MKKFIAMLSALTITSSTASLSVACGSKETEGLDLSKITADTILNWESEYTWVNDQGKENTVKSEKLGSLENDDIEKILSKNLAFIFVTKLTGIDKAKLADQDTSKLNETEQEKIINFGFLMNNAISLPNIKAKEKNSKIFTVTIEVLTWDVANKDDKLKNMISERQKEAKTFLDKSDEEKKAAISKDNMGEEELKDLLKNKIAEYKEWQKENFDQVKAMYDSIKGKDKK